MASKMNIRNFLKKAVILSTLTAFSFASMSLIQNYFNKKHSENAYTQTTMVYDGRNTSVEDRNQDLETSLSAGRVAAQNLESKVAAQTAPDIEWDKTLGGSREDYAYSVQQTSDEGYIVAGTTNSSGSGIYDLWLIKTDSNGNKEWDKTFGGSNSDYAFSVQQTSDKGYIVAGFTKSFGAGYSDFWLIKTDSNGNKEWDKTFGGPDDDEAWSVQQTSDKGYIIAGYTESFGAGSRDFWLIKTDSNGNKDWDKTFGGSSRDCAYSVQQTSDKGYILAGYTRSFRAGISDFWLIKTDSNGNKEWDKTFGGSNYDCAWSVQQTSDKGYIIAGATHSSGAGSSDFWLIKTDQNGNKEWDKIFGGSNSDCAYSVQQTSDRGYILAGYTESFGAGGWDFWIIKLKGNGETSVEETQNQLPTAYSLLQNYPNPFNPTTTITYSIAKPGHVTLEVFNIRGQKVATLFEGNRNAGTYTIRWDVLSQANGIYLAVMKAGGITKTVKMMMMK